MTLPEFDSQLKTVLERARTAGFFGPGPLRVHRASCRAFDAAVDQLLAAGRSPAGSPEPTVVDLGAGGGLPGLPIARWNPQLRMVLLDTSSKRTAFLEWAVSELDLGDRVDVVEARAEDFAHGEQRGRFDGAIARGFASPGITLECAAPLVREGGRILVAGPPGGRHWDSDALAAIGLTVEDSVTGTDVGEPESSGDRSEAVVEVFERFGSVDPALPRPWRQLSKRPRLVERS